MREIRICCLALAAIGLTGSMTAQELRRPDPTYRPASYSQQRATGEHAASAGARTGRGGFSSDESSRYDSNRDDSNRDDANRDATARIRPPFAASNNPNVDRQYRRAAYGEAYGDPRYVEQGYGDARPGSNGYRDPEYDASRYGDSRYSDSRYGDSRYGDSRYGDSRYGDSRYGDSRYGNDANRREGYQSNGYREGEARVDANRADGYSMRRSALTEPTMQRPTAVSLNGFDPAYQEPTLPFDDGATPMEQLPNQDPGIEIDMSGQDQVDARRFEGQFSNVTDSFGVGLDLYSPPDFEGGLIVYGEDIAMKIGGYVKADFIYDFDAIDETDSFVTTSIPLDAPPRTNSRYHARQSRMSFDTRWVSDERSIRIFVEGDFFSDANGFRLRHAYGESEKLLVGQTWTTFTDVAAAPATLDFEGSVANVNRRQAQARYTSRFLSDDMKIAVAIEDTRFIVIPAPLAPGTARSPSPDLVARLRITKEWGQFQIAHVFRMGGFQTVNGDLQTGAAWGINGTGVVPLSDRTKAYYQVLFGSGIGSYRGLPDAAPRSPTEEEKLGLFGWMVGITHDWHTSVTSNFTYASNRLDNTGFQLPDSLHKTDYLAANLIWQPYERVRFGVEYLFGTRQNVDRREGSANRVQLAFIFDLP